MGSTTTSYAFIIAFNVGYIHLFSVMIFLVVVKGRTPALYSAFSCYGIDSWNPVIQYRFLQYHPFESLL